MCRNPTHPEEVLVSRKGITTFTQQPENRQPQTLSQFLPPGHETSVSLTHNKAAGLRSDFIVVYTTFCCTAEH